MDIIKARVNDYLQVLSLALVWISTASYVLFLGVGTQNQDKIIPLLLVAAAGSFGGSVFIRLKQSQMLGMLLVGMLLRDILPVPDFPHEWTSRLWSIALTAAISRAALNLRYSVISRNISTIISLGIIPVFVEAVALTIISVTSFGLPLNWALTLAFGTSCISPGVVVPLILDLVDRGWTAKTSKIALASLSVEVLISTCIFGISLTTCFADTTTYLSILQRILFETLVGLCMGGGIALVYRLMKMVGSADLSTGLSFVLSAFCMVFAKTNNLMCASFLAVFFGWALIANQPGAINKLDPEVDSKLKLIWSAFQPFLFPVIGSMITISPPEFISMCHIFIIVLITTLLKFVVAIFVLRINNTSEKEILVVASAWTGKASCQVMHFLN